MLNRSGMKCIWWHIRPLHIFGWEQVLIVYDVWVNTSLSDTLTLTKLWQIFLAIFVLVVWGGLLCHQIKLIVKKIVSIAFVIKPQVSKLSIFSITWTQFLKIHFLYVILILSLKVTIGFTIWAITHIAIGCTSWQSCMLENELIWNPQIRLINEDEGHFPVFKLLRKLTSIFGRTNVF